MRVSFKFIHTVARLCVDTMNSFKQRLNCYCRVCGLSNLPETPKITLDKVSQQVK